MSVRAGFPSMRRSTISLASQQTIAWLSVMALIVTAVARLAAPVTTAVLVGPDAWLWLFAAVAGFVAAGTSGALGLSAPSRVMGFLGRAMLVMVAFTAVVDPSGVSVPHQVAVAGLGVLGAALATMTLAIFLVGLFAIGLVVVGWGVAHFVPSVGPTLQRFALAAVGRGTLSASDLRQTAAPAVGVFFSGLALSAMVVLAGLAQWLLNGVTAFGAPADNAAKPVRPATGAPAESWASRFRESLSSRKAAGPVVTVYRSQINVARQDGVLVPNRQRHWKVGKSADAALIELREIAEAVVTAYDTALNKAPTRPGDTSDPEEMAASGHRTSKGRFTGYTINVVRAWSEQSQHALVVKITPPAAAEEAARLSPDRIIPLVDSHSSWSYDELKDGLNLSARLRDNTHREGQIGLFVALARETIDAGPAAEDESEPLPEGTIPAAVERALRHLSAGRQFRPTRRVPFSDTNYDLTTYRYSHNVWRGNPTQWQELATLWTSPTLRDAVALYGHVDIALNGSNRGVRLLADTANHEFVVEVRGDAPPFPSGQATDLARFIADNEEHYAAHPYQVCLGLTDRGEPVWWDLLEGPPHSLWAGQTGSGKSFALASVIIQLASANAPDRLGLHLLDSTNEELSAFPDPRSPDPHGFGFGSLPHCRGTAIANSAEIAIDWWSERHEAVKQRQSEYTKLGRPDRLDLLVQEEWQAFAAMLKRPDRDVIEGTINSLAADSRKVAVRVMIATQKATSDIVPTAITANMPVRVMGRSRADDYQATLENRNIDIPAGAPGRLAVRGVRGDEPIIVQSLFATEPTIRKIVREIIARYPSTRRGASTNQPAAPASPVGRSGYNPRDLDAGDEPMAPRRNPGFVSLSGIDGRTSEAPGSANGAIGDDLDAATPRCPTAAEIKRFDAMTAWRIVARNASPGDKVSRATVAEWIDSEGLDGTGNDQLVAGLTALMNLDLVEYQGKTMARIMGSVGWRDGAARIAETIR
jgi:hypothetical protein